MNRRERRAFRAQWDSQIEQERNGAPIPGEIAEQMTKPAAQMLHQVIVTKRGGGGMLAVGPAMIRDAALMFAAAINKQVALGRERAWANAAVVACTPIQGVN